MNHRDLALAAMRGEPVEHIPFIARMDLWFAYHKNQGTLPPRYASASLWDMQRDLGVGIFGFAAWDVLLFDWEYPGIEITVEDNAGMRVTRFQTPHGTLTAVDQMAAELHEAAGAGARIEFPFKSPADYDALQCLLDGARIVPDVDGYERYIASIGTDGLALPYAGHLPAHQLMLKYMGYEHFYLEMADNPGRVGSLVQSLDRQVMEALAVAASTSVLAVQVGGNYDESMTPPPVFRDLFAPFYRRARDVLGEKTLVIHGDGEMRELLSCVMECGVQVVEGLTPAPMTTIDVASTRTLWGDRVAMWGGLPAVIYTDAFTNEQFHGYLEGLFAAVAPGERFILGFGDNVPTDALPGRILETVEFWRDRGDLRRLPQPPG